MEVFFGVVVVVVIVFVIDLLFLLFGCVLMLWIRVVKVLVVVC